jgi:hypothetical protein
MTDETQTESQTETRSDARPPEAEKTGSSGSLAGKILWAVVLIVAGWMLAVWQSPALAPMLPAPVAAWITPQGDSAADEAEARFAALESAAAAAKDVAEDALSAASDAGDAARSAMESAEAGGDSALAGRVDALEAALDALTDEVAAIRGQFGAIEAAVEGGGEVDFGDMPQRLAALEALAEDQQALFDAARGETEKGVRAVGVATSLAAIDRAMTFGAPFPDALAELEDASGATAPAVLAEAAASGAPTREALKASFPDAAHAAITAALVDEAGGDEDAFAGILARIHARVTGLPTSATPGDSAPAVLSRARYALLNGDLDSAIAAIQALPEAAQEAMAGWTAGAQLRSDADSALAAWRAQIKTTL